MSTKDMSKQRAEVPYGTLDLLILKTLETMGEMNGYRIARRIEQVSGDALKLSQGAIYPALIRLEQEGWIRAKWGISGTNRKVKLYSLTKASTNQLKAEVQKWEQANALVTRFLEAALGGGAGESNVFWRWCRGRRLDRELEAEAEVEAHLEMAERDARKAGLPAEEARWAARRRFGGIEQMKGEHRDRRSVRWIETGVREFRIAVRTLGRAPGFVVVAVLTLALGIGATAGGSVNISV